MHWRTAFQEYVMGSHQHVVQASPAPRGTYVRTFSRRGSGFSCSMDYLPRRGPAARLFQRTGTLARDQIRDVLRAAEAASAAHAESRRQVGIRWERRSGMAAGGRPLPG